MVISLFNFQDLEQASLQNDAQNQYAERKFKQHLSRACNDLQTFQVNFDKHFLECAVSELLLALKYKKNQPKPYIYMAYAMFCINQDSTGFSYLQQAKAFTTSPSERDMIQGLLSGVANIKQTLTGITEQDLKFFEG